MSAEHFFDHEQANAVEGPDWAPPVAPMDMPTQRVEAPAGEGFLAWLVRMIRPFARA